uniref:Uncharacterized protein n=1 Tax=Arundo donax TaxID=35708 RepID=A0A0A8ZVG2_ARUDO
MPTVSHQSVRQMLKSFNACGASKYLTPSG